MPRVRLDISAEDTRRSTDHRPDIRIDTDVFATLSGENEPTPETTPTIVRWLESWRP
jgi:hypothetical protein